MEKYKSLKLGDERLISMNYFIVLGWQSSAKTRSPFLMDFLKNVYVRERFAAFIGTIKTAATVAPVIPQMLCRKALIGPISKKLTDWFQSKAGILQEKGM